MNEAGFDSEWRGCHLDDISQAKLHLVDPSQKTIVSDGFLNWQWVRRDLLGMPKTWKEFDGSVFLLIPASALERVVEEFEAFRVGFELV